MHFTPNGRMVVKYKTVTYKMDNKGGVKSIAIIKFLFQLLVDNMKEFSKKKKYFVI